MLSKQPKFRRNNQNSEEIVENITKQSQKGIKNLSKKENITENCRKQSISLIGVFFFAYCASKFVFISPGTVTFSVINFWYHETA